MYGLDLTEHSNIYIYIYVYIIIYIYIIAHFKILYPTLFEKTNNSYRKILIYDKIGLLLAQLTF